MLTVKLVALSILASFTGGQSMSRAAPPRPFTVVDGFERKRLFPVTPAEWLQENPFLVSKDGKRLFLIVGAGNAAELTYDFQLNMLDIDQITAFARGHSSHIPLQQTLVRVAFNQSDRGIADMSHNDAAGIKWLTLYDNDTRLMYLAVDNSNIYQLFSLEISSRKITQITKGDKHVLQYKLLEGRNEILFLTGRYTSQGHCGLPSYSIAELYLFDLQCNGEGKSVLDIRFAEQPPVFPSSFSGMDIQKIPLESETEATLIASNVRLAGGISDLAVSPDGRWALMSVTANEKSHESLDLSLPTNVSNDNSADSQPSRRDVAEATQVVTLAGLDLDSGRMVPFSDIVIGQSRVKPQWVTSDKVYLPGVTIHEAAAQEESYKPKEHRNSNTGVMVRFVSDGYQAYLAPRSVGQSAKGRRSHSPDIEQRCSTTVNGRRTFNDNKPSCYVQFGDKHLRIWINEAYDRPPVVVATDLRSARNAELLRLNPRFDEMDLGKVEVLRWIDENGSEWRGGLVLPPSFQAGKRYPLVVQFSGFSLERFLLDGAPDLTAPFAAQALANRDMVVLQMPMDSEPMAPAGESMMFGYARGANAAIKLLDERGLVDTGRIGLVGYSYTGRVVFNMTAFPVYPPEAVVISDAFSPSPLGYVSNYRMHSSALKVHEDMTCGSMPWGSTQSEWIRRNPFYHLDKIHAAIRLEKNQTGTDWWDIFVGLRRLGKPVEHRLWQVGGHPPLDPRLVLQSQQRNVDWFDYWLNGRVSDDPAKVDQYREWRELRRKKEAQSRQSSAATPLSKMDCQESIHNP